MNSLPIVLPSGFKATVFLGDKVKTGEIVAQKSQEAIYKINLSQELHVAPKQVIKNLKKHLGDRVEIGEVIASKSNFLGLGQKVVKSGISGTIVRLDESLGILSIISANNIEGSKDVIVTPLDGEILLCDNEKVVLKVDKKAILGVRGIGESVEGETLLIGEESIDVDKLNSNLSEKIIIGGSFDKEALSKSLGLGVKGIVAQNIQDEDFKSLMQKNMKTPIVQIEKEDFKELVKTVSNRKKLLLNGEGRLIIDL